MFVLFPEPQPEAGHAPRHRAALGVWPGGLHRGELPPREDPGGLPSMPSGEARGAWANSDRAAASVS